MNFWKLKEKVAEFLVKNFIAEHCFLLLIIIRQESAEAALDLRYIFQ